MEWEYCVETDFLNGGSKHFIMDTWKSHTKNLWHFTKQKVDMKIPINQLSKYKHSDQILGT